MKKIALLIITFVSLLSFLFAQNSEDKIPKTVLEQFSLKLLPVENIYASDAQKNNPLNAEYNVLFDIKSPNEVYPVCRFKIYADYIGLWAIITSADDDLHQLFITDKNGNIISKQKIKCYDPEYIQFDITADYSVVQKYINTERVGFYAEETDGCATYMTATAESEEINRYEYKIEVNGKIVKHYRELSLECVQNFLNTLAWGNYKEAYDLQKNENWGSYEKFSSEQSFGGITGISINELKYLSGNSSEAQIFCDALYRDRINGDADIQQTFFLTNISDKWFITGMNVKNFERRRNYEDDENILRYLDFRLTKLSESGFDFYIEAVAKESCKDEYGHPYINLMGKAEADSFKKAVYTNDDFKLEFNFADNGKQISLSAVGYENRYPQLVHFLGKTFTLKL